jgi:hypothetical protein
VRIRTLVIVLVTVLAAYGVLNSFAGLVLLTRNSLPANANLGPLSPSLWYGDGEPYLLRYSYYRVPNYTQIWPTLLKNVTAYNAEFHWKVFRLLFTFSNLNTTFPSSRPVNPLNFTQMNNVISILAANGYRVILTDADYASFGSHTWVQDWRNVTKHYKGDIRIAAFEIYNEPTSYTWSGNVTSNAAVASAYVNCTDAIHQIDSSREVVWEIRYFNYNLLASEVRGNVVGMFHLYTNVSQIWVNGVISNSIKFRQAYSIPVYCGEVNVFQQNMSFTVWEIHSLQLKSIPWIVNQYRIYNSYWDQVLPLVALSS